MKTTTYIYSQGKTTITVSDKPVLTRAQYAHACRVLSMAAQDAKSRKQAIDILRKCAVKTQLMSAAWRKLVHADQYLTGLPAESVLAYVSAARDHLRSAEAIRRNTMDYADQLPVNNGGF